MRGRWEDDGGCVLREEGRGEGCEEEREEEEEERVNNGGKMKGRKR